MDSQTKDLEYEKGTPVTIFADISGKNRIPYLINFGYICQLSADVLCLRHTDSWRINLTHQGKKI